jgi:hypothetical protein
MVQGTQVLWFLLFIGFAITIYPPAIILDEGRKEDNYWKQMSGGFGVVFSVVAIIYCWYKIHIIGNAAKQLEVASSFSGH